MSTKVLPLLVSDKRATSSLGQSELNCTGQTALDLRQEKIQSLGKGFPI